MVFFLVMLSLFAVGCTTADDGAAVPEPTTAPTATPVPEFVRFFEPDLPKVDEVVWSEITEVPPHWPPLVSIPETLRTNDGSFVESTRPDGTRVLTGRFYFDPSDNYGHDLRDRLMSAGFVSERLYESDLAMLDTLRSGDSQVEIMSGVFGYAIIDVIE